MYHRIIRNLSLLFILSLFSLIFFNCSSSIAPYDQNAYLQDTLIKSEALNLMDKAVDSFSIHEAEVKDIQSKIDKEYELEKSRPNNSNTARLWDNMRNPERDLLGGFLRAWKNQVILLPAYIKNMKTGIELVFNEIIESESNKPKEK